jgi:hypothetical protein
MGPKLTEALAGRTLRQLSDDELGDLRTHLGHSIPVPDENQIDDEQERRLSARQAAPIRAVLIGIDVTIGDLVVLYLKSLVAMIAIALPVAIVIAMIAAWREQR